MPFEESIADDACGILKKTSDKWTTSGERLTHS